MTAAQRSPGDAQTLDDPVVSALLPVRPPRSHKMQSGRLLVVAGSLDYAGAALLVARAAGRAGAGLVRLAVPRSLQHVLAGRVLEATTLGLEESANGRIDVDAAMERLAAEEHQALAIGPGLAPGDETRSLVGRLLAEAGAPAVVDAEGLNSLARTERWWDRAARPCVLTPHVGEFRRLRPDVGDADLVMDDAARLVAARAAAAEWRQVVVLKGAHTAIAAPGGTAAVAAFETPALATAGTGDVLTGTIGALLAAGMEPYDAARAGVYLHAVAAEAVSERTGTSGLLASDLPDEIARVWRRLAAVRERREAGQRLGFGAAARER